MSVIKFMLYFLFFIMFFTILKATISFEGAVMWGLGYIFATIKENSPQQERKIK